MVTAKDNNLALINNLDLVLKWMTIRFFDTNPSLLLKCLGYLDKMFDVLLVQNYNLLDTEASSFIPYLITKVKIINNKKLQVLPIFLCVIYSWVIRMNL